MNNLNTAISHTKQWLIKSVINYQFCPYAKQPFEQNIIGYHGYTGTDVIELLTTLAHCCITLDEHTCNTLETSLLIIANDDSNYLTNFYDYLEVLAIVNDFLDHPHAFTIHFSDEFQEENSKKIPQSWADKYQVASFHPEYQFEGTTSEDLENFTNRSPYPIFHLIRNASIEAVRMNNKRAEQIVAQNINTIEGLSAEALQRLRDLSISTK